MKRLTEQDIQNIRDLYSKIGTYAGVARETGFSASTVKKYVSDIAPAPKGKKAAQELPKVEFDQTLLRPFDPTPFCQSSWNTLLIHTEESIAKVKELWEEIRV